MKLIITRPLGQAAPWVMRLQALGVDAQALPLIHIDTLEDPTPLRNVWARLAGYMMVVFVSANAVQHFFAAGAPAGGHRTAWPHGVAAASTGPGTSAALRTAGVLPTQLVEPDPGAGRFDSEGLWEELQSRSWSGRRVLVVRGEEGRDWLADALRSRGAEVDFVAAYRRCPPRLDAEHSALLQQAVAEPDRHAWHFSSSEAIGFLGGLAAALHPPPDWRHGRAIASHPRIVQTACDLGFGQVQQVGVDLQSVADWWSDPARWQRKPRTP